MKKISLTVVISLLCLVQTQAQDMLITSRGDTVKGKISIFKTNNGNELVNIKVNRKKQQFKLVEISKFYRKGEAYKTLYAEGRYRVGKIINENKFLSEYLYTPTSPNPQPDFSQTLLMKESGDHLQVPKALMFRNAISKFLSDCPEVSRKVENKAYSRSQLSLIIRDYNECMSAGIAEVVKSRTLSSLVNDLRGKLQKSKKIEGKADIRQMLKDLETKISAKEEVPSYLKIALTNSLKDDLELSSILLEILDYK